MMDKCHFYQMFVGNNEYCGWVQYLKCTVLASKRGGKMITQHGHTVICPNSHTNSATATSLQNLSDIEHDETFFFYCFSCSLIKFSAEILIQQRNVLSWNFINNETLQTHNKVYSLSGNLISEINIAWQQCIKVLNFHVHVGEKNSTRKMLDKCQFY